jgi:hypothetical protein
MGRLMPPPGDRRFTLRLEQTAHGAWQVVAEGVAEGGFLDGLRLRARVIGADQEETVTLEQRGPGHYTGKIEMGGPFHATVIREGEEKALVGHLQAPAVETREWPATVDRVLAAEDIPSSESILPAHAEEAAVWQPPVVGLVRVAPGLWLLGALAGLVALWLRR